MTNPHAGIRTAAVLAQIPADGSPVAIRDIASVLGARSSGEISGHMTHLHRTGKIRDQASTAEQLRVSAAIAMALSPALRVLIVREGSLLDSTSLAMLAEMAAEKDFVVLCETVDESGQVGIYIEDGSIAAVNGQAVPA